MPTCTAIIGLPKAIVYTNQNMATLDAARLMPGVHEETTIDHLMGCRWHSPVPSLHVSRRKALFTG